MHKEKPDITSLLLQTVSPSAGDAIWALGREPGGGGPVLAWGSWGPQLCPRAPSPHARPQPLFAVTQNSPCLLRTPRGSLNITTAHSPPGPVSGTDSPSRAQRGRSVPGGRVTRYMTPHSPWSSLDLSFPKALRWLKDCRTWKRVAWPMCAWPKAQSITTQPGT